jgi:hypothetical protein
MAFDRYRYQYTDLIYILKHTIAVSFDDSDSFYVSR